MTLTRLLFSRAYTGWRLIALWLSGGCTIVLSLVMPQQVGRLTNLFTHGTLISWPTVRNAVLMMILAQLAISALSYVRRRVQAIHTEFITRNLTLTVFSRVMKFSADFFRDSEVATINARILDDSDRVASFWVDATAGVPQAIISVLFYGTIMIVRAPLLGACMVPLSLLSGYYLFFDRRIQAVNRRSRQTRDRIYADSHEMISAVSEYRNHCAFDYGQASLSRGLLAYQTVMMETGKLTALFLAASPLVACIQTGMLYFIGAWLCIHGSMKWGDVIAFLLLAQLFQRPVSDVAGFGLSWRMSRESLRRMDEMMQRPCAFESAPTAPTVPEKAELRFDAVCVATETGGLILSSLAESIPFGEHVAMCGPAGCGKSTAMQLIVRNGAPSSGRMALDGRAVEEYDMTSLARQIGLVSQKPAILNMSLRNNLLLGLRRTSECGLHDSEGPLDVAYLSSIASIADLDRRLVQVIREIGLEEDAFHKCMESTLNSDAVGNALIASLPQLRQFIADGLHLVEGDLIPLRPRIYFPGTIGENLFGPGFASMRTLEDAAASFSGLAEEMPIFAEVLQLGWARLRREQALAVRVSNRVPGLIPFLKSRPADARVWLADEIQSADFVALEELSPRLQAALVEAALDVDSPGNYGESAPGTFEERILQVRKQLIESDVSVRGRWEMIDSDTWCPALTVRENLLRARCHPRRRDAVERADAVIGDALRQRSLFDAALLLGLEFRAGEDGKFLSGGQKQKLAMGRILMKDPRILLLDEATSAMDELSQRRIVDLVRSRFAGKTVVAISHRLATVRDYDRILVLDRGRVIESGRYEELATAGGLFAQLVHQESGKPDLPPRAAQAAATSARSLPQAAARDGFYDAEVARQLSLCPLFSDLPSDRLGFLASIARVFQFRPGELLFNRGDAGNEIFVILDGEVEFFMPPNPESSGDAEKSVTRYQTGRAFGELAVFGQGVRSLSARATVPCRVAAIDREQLLPVMSAVPQIALAMLKALSERLVALTETRVA